jgi:hypothetical protein
MINSVPNDVLLMIFRYMPNIKDICAISQVCKRWHHLCRNESLPFNHERLERIAFENIDRFDQLPRVHFELKLSAFTIFQDRVIGQTEEGDICIYNPKTAATCFLNNEPLRCGEFVTSSAACVYRFTRNRWYNIDIVNQTCVKLDLKMKYRQYALLGKKLYSWEFISPLQHMLATLHLGQSHDRLHPYTAMQVYDLEDNSVAELTYRTTRQPEFHISGDRMLLTVHRWTSILDSNLRDCAPKTYFKATHLLGKKLLHVGYDSITIRNVAYNRDDRTEEKYKLSIDYFSNLHPFFIEGAGWKFLQFNGIYWNRAMWFLENGSLKRVNFVQDL